LMSMMLIVIDLKLMNFLHAVSSQSDGLHDDLPSHGLL
jgi:hypothetical protein